MLHPIDYKLQFKAIDEHTALRMDDEWERFIEYPDAERAYKYALRRETLGYDVAFAYVEDREGRAYWNQWIRYLRRAAKHGGFRVW